MARVGLAARAGDAAALSKALANTDLAILDLDHSRMGRYSRALIQGVGATVLPSHTQLQDIVDAVNNEYTEDLRRVEAVEAVNAAVRADGRGLCEALAGLGLRLGRAEERRCLEELLAIRADRSRMEGQDMELWIEDIHEAVETTQARAGQFRLIYSQCCGSGAALNLSPGPGWECGAGSKCRSVPKAKFT